MFVTKVELKNFRNYEQCSLDLTAGRHILIGENAQGKTNFLEAIELLATGKSTRADKDFDLLRWGGDALHAEVTYFAGGHEETVRVRMAKAANGTGKSARLDKLISINGVHQKSMNDLLGRLLVVTFASHDLNLLRGGPKFRREWLDGLILKLRPMFVETFSNYAKSIAQRNRLLKSIFERGKVTVGDQDQLAVWDKQVARFGARIIKQRLSLLSELLPIAEAHQSRISRSTESLSIRYFFKANEKQSSESWLGNDEDDATSDGDADEAAVATGPLTASQLAEMEEIELAKTLYRLLKDRRAEEIRRKQTTVGPHRDDLIFCLNDTDAVSFASQGQQRSIVLSLKSAEVTLIRHALNDSPVLLLDDVMAELDEFRQQLLMTFVQEGLQTIITTTHVTGFDQRWLEDSTIFKVHGGRVERLLPAETL